MAKPKLTKSISKGEELKTLNIPLSGRWRSSLDPTQLGEGDFQTLKNMRYGESSPQSISGMTKVNTTIINATYFKPRSGFHFKKSQPVESHVLVQSWNTGLTIPLVYENITAIPSQGNFVATALWTDAASASVGRFSDAPDGCIVYANGKDTCIWGGYEYRCAGFVTGSLNLTTKYDYTSRITNTLDDANNIATLIPVATAADASTMLLLHFDNNVTDSSPTTAHTVTNVSSKVTFSDSVCKWEYSAVFDGVSAYCTIPDNGDFDLSAGTFTMDFWVRPDITGEDIQAIYFQKTDANNYMAIGLVKSGTKFSVIVSIYATGAEVLGTTGLQTGDILDDATWYHIEVVENGNSWYIFVDGVSQATLTDASRAANYNSVVYLGCDNTSALDHYFKGYIDEFRLSNAARHTAGFTKRTIPHAPDTCFGFIGSTRPIKGVKFYVKTANASPAVTTGYYWASDGTWTALPATWADGTDITGETLAQTGSMTFGTTVGLANPSFINQVYIYWYLFTFENIDAATSVSYITIDAPFQKVVDLWDGVFRPISSCLRYMTGYSKLKYLDNTKNVLEQDYVSGDGISYAPMNGLTAEQHLLLGFSERSCGFKVTFVHSGATNTDRTNDQAAVMTVSYWSGSAWVATTGLDDGTIANTTDSFGQNGTVTWVPPTEASEFKTSIGKNVELYWYYKVSFDATLLSGAGVYVDQIQGIPAQKNIHGYSLPIMWQNRLVLINDNSYKQNSIILSSVDSICIFNGSDAIGPEAPMVFGKEEGLNAGGVVYSKFAGNTYEDLILTKINETWLISGTTPQDYKKFKVSDDGCVAPGTFKSCNTGYEISPGLFKHVLIWQSDSAINLFDGNAIMPISGDISNYFDRTTSECINSSMIHKSESFFDERNLEYHWLLASGAATSLDTELVYDLMKKKWYQIDRGTGSYLQMGFSVRDTYGNAYNYGSIDTGYITRLDNGTTFVTAASANNIISTLRTGDIAVGGLDIITEIRRIKHMVKAKATTTQSVSITHYGDSCNTATVNKNNSKSVTVSHAVKSTTHRVLKKVESLGWGDFIFHSINCAITTSNESVAYEPIAMSIQFKVIRQEMPTL